MDEKGARKESSNGIEKVYNNKGNLILEAYKNGGTYQIKEAREQGMKVEIDEVKEWHEKLGHAAKTAMNNMYKICMINKSISSFSCNDCARNKQVKTISHIAHPKTTEPGRRTHFDIFGLITPPTPSDNRYLIVGVNKATKYVTVYLLRSCEEASSKIQAHIQHLRNAHKMHPAFVKTDGVREFRSNTQEEWLIKEGIQYDISPAPGRERNGLAERNIRTIQYRIRVIGNASSTP
jgi:transposase-like protein